MPLTKCPDCDKQISDLAPACPHCGRPMKTRPPDVEDVNATGFLGKPGTGTHTLNVGCATLLIAIFVLLVLVSIITHFQS